MLISNINTKKIQQVFQEENNLNFLTWLNKNIGNLPRESEYVKDHKIVYEALQKSFSTLAFVPAFKMFSNITLQSAQLDNWFILNAAMRNHRHVFYSIDLDNDYFDYNLREELKASAESEAVQLELYSFVKMKWSELIPRLNINQAYFLSEQFNNLYWTSMRISGKISLQTESLFAQHRQLFGSITQDKRFI